MRRRHLRCGLYQQQEISLWLVEILEIKRLLEETRRVVGFKDLLHCTSPGAP